MAKVALLLGVSEYQSGLNPLPAALRDIEAMKRVLLHPDMGSFDEVKALPNADFSAMHAAIENLFSSSKRDDVALLFFSGHGVTDKLGNLYLTTPSTCKNKEGEVIKSTAVSARFVHDVMHNSRCRRRIVILDCCFSGAFAKGMIAKDDGFVNVAEQLGGEGWVVLTSSTSREYSFEQQDSELSVYTRFLVHGLETGEADLGSDGRVGIGELHEYAKRRVQEVVPGMNPEIYPGKEGYKIILANVPPNDPVSRYRQEVWQAAHRGEITFRQQNFADQVRDWLSMPAQSDVLTVPYRRKILNALSHRLGLPPEMVSKIETEVLQPYRDFYKRLKEYEQELIQQLRKENPLTVSSRRVLKELQHYLEIPDEHAAQAELRLAQKIQKKRILEKNLFSNWTNFKALYWSVNLILATTTIGVLAHLLKPAQFGKLSEQNIPSLEKSPLFIPTEPESTPEPNRLPPIQISPEPTTTPNVETSSKSHNQKGIEYYNLGIKSKNQRNFDAAKDYFQRAISEYSQAIAADPNNGVFYLNRGNAYSALMDRYSSAQDYSKAVSEFSQAITTDPANEVLYLNRGNAHFYLGNKDQSIEDYNKGIKLNSSYPALYEARGNARAKLFEDLAGAEADYQKARQLYVEQDKARDAERVGEIILNFR